MTAETSILTILAFAALGLLLAVTGGVTYLTAAEWRDRRRREREAKEQRDEFEAFDSTLRRDHASQVDGWNIEVSKTSYIGMAPSAMVPTAFFPTATPNTTPRRSRRRSCMYAWRRCIHAAWYKAVARLTSEQLLARPSPGWPDSILRASPFLRRRSCYVRKEVSSLLYLAWCVELGHCHQIVSHAVT